MLISLQLLIGIVKEIINTMWTGRGRGRARGRAMTIEPFEEQRPGAMANAEDEENWDTGIKTKYSIPSVRYIGNQKIQIVPNSNTHTNPPIQGNTRNSGISNTTHDRTSTQKNENPTTIIPAKIEGQPPDAYKLESDEESDCEGGWDFGDTDKSAKNTKRKPDQKVVTQDTPEEVDISGIAQKNPGVSVAWLESILNKGPKKSQNAKGRGSQKLWQETELFTPESRAESERWLRKIEGEWSRRDSKMGQEMSQFVQQCFSMVQNPYVTALYIVESTQDYRVPKSSTLSHQIAREFERWTKRAAGQTECLLHNGGEPLQVYAFYVGTRFHMTSFETIARAFKLAHRDNQFFIPHVKPFVEQNRLKEACQCIAKLDLHDHFDTEEILLPLILQDKINLVESYVYQRKQQQVELLKLLDRMCDDDINLNKLADDSGVTDIRYDKLERKIISKLAIRLMKLYQIPQDTCPNIDHRRNISALRFLLYKFYIEESVSRETWRELVLPSVDNKQRLQEFLVDELVTSLDIPEAVWWARRYNLPPAVLPQQVIEAMEDEEYPDTMAGPPPDSGENWDEELLTQSSLYYTLQIPQSEIYFVDTRNEYLRAVRYLVETADMIGIDSEWRPSLAQGAGTRVALLQMATRDRVYLFDTICLCHDLSDDDWNLLGEQVFLNSQIIKLGYGFEGDIQMLVNSIPTLKKPIINSSRMIELQKLHKHVRKNPGAFKSTQPIEDRIPPNAALRYLKSDERGLSDLVRHCLGQPLDKAEQMSDWEKRPLRLAQVVYAALDAHVLIALYEHIVSRAKGLDTALHLEPRVTAKAQPHRTRLQRKQARVAERTAEQVEAVTLPAPVQGPPISPSEFSVVVDTMIQGVGRYLRSCGVDVRILESNEDHDAAVDIALRENRVILTCGQPYLSMRTQVPEGMCYQVSTSEKSRQQAIDILNHFNIRVTEDDIFSRCPSCNGDHYLHIKPSEMRQAYDRAAQLSREGRVQMGFRKYPAVKNPSKPVRPNRISINDPNFTFDHIDMETVTIGAGVALNVGAIPRQVTYQVPVFYCCSSCGKVFWEGKHFTDICEQFSEVLNRNPAERVKEPEEDVAGAIKEMLTLKD